MTEQTVAKISTVSCTRPLETAMMEYMDKLGTLKEDVMQLDGGKEC